MATIEKSILEHRELLAGYAWKLTRDHEAARDLLQDTLFKALAKSNTFIGGYDMRPWLCTIMRNMHINNCRRKNLEKKLFSQGKLYSMTPVDLSAQALTMARLELKELWKKIGAMPRVLRLPLQLLSQGYKYQEIAEIMATSVGTTKSRIHTARLLLKRVPI